MNVATDLDGFGNVLIVRRMSESESADGAFLFFYAAAKHLFWIGWIVKQNRQFDAAMAELWKVGFRRIAGVKIRRGVIRRKQHQRIQERLQCNLSTTSQRRILVP